MKVWLDRLLLLEASQRRKITPAVTSVFGAQKVSLATPSRPRALATTLVNRFGRSLAFFTSWVIFKDCELYSESLWKTRLYGSKPFLYRNCNQGDPCNLAPTTSRSMVYNVKAFRKRGSNELGIVVASCFVVYLQIEWQFLCQSNILYFGVLFSPF